MTQRTISDDGRRFRFELQVNDPILEDAIEHYSADDVLKCAVLMALSVLAESGPWPDAALESMSDFMTGMKTSLIEQMA